MSDKNKVFVVKEDKFSFSLDLFANETIEEEPKKKFQLTEETKQMEVKDPINVVPVTEVNKEGVIKYSLEDYLQKEDELLSSKPVAEVKEPIDEELNFAVKKTEPEVKKTPVFETESPFEMTIEETLKARSEERKRKMKEFNYKFNNSATYIDEIEKEPAYKRMGIDVTSAPTDSNAKSRMSLGTDSNDDLQLRSNNSFLHDNVD